MASLYRKWRSRSFDDLFGQDHVVRTLRNAVRQKRVAHAYLFTGPRGTGKTSTARILARAVNCLDPQDGNPCNVCATCLAAQEGRALDVIEIDAASNTSVDNVRDLRERVAYAAGEAEYKVYIVDEVHRLSGAAFDAFLKTLEEPPPHVIFVFASTEPHKVPATIASRCQRFDFRRIPASISAARLRQVSDTEQLKAGDDVLQLIAYSANGSLRDALGLLDQVAAFEAGEITEDVVRQTLGLADPEVIARLADSLIAGNIGAGLAELSSFVEAGGDAKQLMTQFTTYFRALLHEVSGSRKEAPGLDPGMQAHLKRHAARLDEAKTLAVLHAMTQTEISPKYDLLASLPFEIAYVQAILDIAPSTPGSVAASPAAPGSSPTPTLRADQPVGTPSAAASPGALGPSPTPAVGADQRVGPPSEDANPTESLWRPDASPAMGERSEEDATDPGNTQEGPPSSALHEANGSEPPSPRGHGDDAWTEIVQRMKPTSPVLQALLRSAYLLKVEHGVLTVGFLYDFHQEQVSKPTSKAQLEQVASEVLGTRYVVKCVHTTREEVAALRGADAVQQDDGFIEEAAERIRRFHMTQLTGGNG